MICVICKNGETEQGTTTSTLEKDDSIVFVRDIPARVCNNCGEAYIDSQTLSRLEDLSPENSERDYDTEVVVLRYGAGEVHKPVSGRSELTPEQRERAIEFIARLGLASHTFNKREHEGGYRLYVAASSKRPPRFGYVGLKRDGRLTVYAIGDFSDPKNKFTAQPKNPRDAWYKFWPGDKVAIDYAARVVTSAYESRSQMSSQKRVGSR